MPRPSRETRSRPRLSKVMFTSEKVRSSSGVLTACSTRKPDGTVNRPVPPLTPQTMSFHGPTLPYSPSTLAACHLASLKPGFSQPLGAELDDFHLPSLLRILTVS